MFSAASHAKPAAHGDGMDGVVPTAAGSHGPSRGANIDDRDDAAEDDDDADMEVVHTSKNLKLHEPHLHVSPAKGILKNSNPNLTTETANLVSATSKKPRESDSEPNSGRRKSLKWDEEKLQETEAQRGQATMKITEPKTPYIYYNQSTDEVFGASHEQLGNAVPPLELTTAVHAAISKMDTEEPPKKYDDWDSDHEGEAKDHHVHENFGEHEENEGEFKKHRSEHYNMKRALMKARELMASDPELNEDE